MVQWVFVTNEFLANGVARFEYGFHIAVKQTLFVASPHWPTD